MRICLFVCFLVFPAVGLWSNRYLTVLKPAKEEHEKKVAEDLLSEGRANVI